LYFTSILLSQPFKFIIGHQKKLFTIHENAVSRLSKSLNDLLNGSMKEANEHCVYWEDVDEKTFLRFAQWAYTGEYSPAEPDLITASAQLASLKLSSTPKASVDNTARSLASFNINICLQCRKTPQKVSKKQSMIQAFNDNKGFSSPTILHTPRKNTESYEEYSEVFLSHARLYTLADKYDIPELRKLSLHKIYVSLKEFTLYPNRIGDVVKLVSYSFENTITGDRLRTLLVDYCTCILEDMLENEGFKDLVDKSPDFAFELIRKLGNRLD
ncbi:hypothetical protein TRIATDRAFT_35595, partial [Trichoderma atroviride IMI 206040]